MRRTKILSLLQALNWYWFSLFKTLRTLTTSFSTVAGSVVSTPTIAANSSTFSFVFPSSSNSSKLTSSSDSSPHASLDESVSDLAQERSSRTSQ